MTVVDIHSHLYPDWFLDHLRSRAEVPRVVEEDGAERLHLFTTTDGVASGPLLTDEYTTIDAKLAFMSRHGIDRSVVSLGNPWLETLEPSAAPDLAREANARLATLAAETSGRVYGMGVLPPAAPSVVATVVREVAAEPGLRGVIASTTISGLMFDDAGLEPVWESLAETGVPLMVHPMITVLPPDLAGYGIALSAGVGFPFQTTVALARLLLAGVLDRYPQVRIVAAHAGGALPFLIGRLEGTHHGGPGERSLRSAAGGLLLDAALYDADAVRMAADLVGADRLLFGTDHPFPNADVPRISAAIGSGLSRSEASLVMGGAAASWYDLPA